MCFRVKTYFTTANAEMQNSLIHSSWQTWNEKTATKLVPFKLMAISNSSSLKQPAFLKHENAMKSLSNNVGGPRIWGVITAKIRQCHYAIVPCHYSIVPCNYAIVPCNYAIVPCNSFCYFVVYGYNFAILFAILKFYLPFLCNSIFSFDISF
jgi:hypothetical protein